MPLPVILKREPLVVAAGVSTLTKVTFERNPFPALLKEPAQFWDEIFIANEAYMLAEITHPRIRQKLAYEAATHQLYLNYIEGVTLSELVQGGVTRRDPRRTYQLLQSLAETLADLHAGNLCGRPIVHNDVKCLNVLVPAAAPAETVLIDLSHSYFEGRLPPFITDKKQTPVGTAKYLAPEKWLGDYTQGFKSDVFAFGVLAYYVYTGHYPFAGDAAQLEEAIREVTPPSPLQLGVEIPRNHLSLVMACLGKKPQQRPTMEYVARSYAESASLFN
jgi:serine/threonine-protein kinase